MPLHVVVVVVVVGVIGRRRFAPLQQSALYTYIHICTVRVVLLAQKYSIWDDVARVVVSAV